SLQLYMKVDGAWTLFLDISVHGALRLSSCPVKWLRYLGWCIHGQPGQLATSDGSQVAEDPVPPHFIDVNAIDDRTSDAKRFNSTPRFRDDVINRDGTCIITGDAPLNCTVCHILPHAKGDNVFQYVRSLMDFRGIQGPARVIEIGDVRNGILLSNGLHRPFGAGEVAFLLTPNLYLAPDDIP
ncbi:hypothetical protein B0H17DRAFT_863091, partial [Mycena rosella]